MARLVQESIKRCELDLRGCRVLTEAATGPYVVTPVLAAAAGAQVVAVTGASRHGSVDDVIRATRAVGTLLDVNDQIDIRDRRILDDFAAADVITNSGHLRPITGKFADAIRSDA